MHVGPHPRTRHTLHTQHVIRTHIRVHACFTLAQCMRTLAPYSPHTHSHTHADASIVFQYLPRLDLVCVKESGLPSGCLATLAPRDTGAESPNLANAFQLDEWCGFPALLFHPSLAFPAPFLHSMLIPFSLLYKSNYHSGAVSQQIRAHK